MSINSLSYLKFDILRLLNVTSNGVAGLSIYDLLLVFNSNQKRTLYLSLFNISPLGHESQG